MSSVGTKIAETGGKGWNIVQDYFVKARDSASEFAAQINQKKNPQSLDQLFQQSLQTEETNGQSNHGDEDLYKSTSKQEDEEQVYEQKQEDDLEDWLNDASNKKVIPKEDSGDQESEDKPKKNSGSDRGQ